MSSPFDSMTRFDLPCGMTGLPAPGFRLRLDFPLVVETPLHVTCRTTPDRLGAVRRWLEGLGATRVQWGPGLAPRESHGWFDDIPSPLARLLALRPNHADIGPGGMASLFVRATMREIAAFAAACGAAGRARPAAPPPGPGTLSPRQREALSTAVALGYYDLPRAVSLRALARDIGVSLGSLSELLRRAEAAVLNGYVDSLSLPGPRLVAPTAPPSFAGAGSPADGSMDDVPVHG